VHEGKRWEKYNREGGWETWGWNREGRQKENSNKSGGKLGSGGACRAVLILVKNKEMGLD
jgi:hypothetical protein